MRKYNIKILKVKNIIKLKLHYTIIISENKTKIIY